MSIDKNLKFCNYDFLSKKFGVIRFQLKLGDIVSPFIELSVKKGMDFLSSYDGNEIEVELGDKIFRIVDARNKNNVILWYTPDKFLYDYWSNKIEVDTDETFSHRDFTHYDLYYVGISKQKDTFQDYLKRLTMLG